MSGASPIAGLPADGSSTQWRTRWPRRRSPIWIATPGRTSRTRRATRGCGRRLQALHEGTDYAVCGSTADTIIFDRAWMLRGMAQFLADLLVDPDFALALLEKVAAVQYRRHECFLKQVGSYLDVLVVADDMGVQNAPLIRPDLYRKMVKPFHRRYVEVIRRQRARRSSTTPAAASPT